ncbi:MAG: hypothetical protein ACK5PB_07895 [Pirellula sp.]
MDRVDDIDGDDQIDGVDFVDCIELVAISTASLSRLAVLVRDNYRSMMGGNYSPTPWLVMDLI